VANYFEARTKKVQIKKNPTELILISFKNSYLFLKSGKTAKALFVLM
jgi:hypothetical protein